MTCYKIRSSPQANQEPMITSKQMTMPFDTKSLGIWEVDIPTENVTLCERAREICGFDREKPTCLADLFNVISVRQRNELISKISRAVVSGRKFHQEIYINSAVTKSSTLVHLNGHIILGENCRPNRIIGMIAEISADDQHRFGFADLLALISHELKTPLTVMKLYIQLVEKMTPQLSGQPVRQYLSMASREVDNMSMLMDNFLDISAIETGKISLVPERFEINTLLRDVLQYWSAIAPDYQFVYLESMQAHIEADLFKIRQVLYNLLGNAVKYSPAGSQIRLSCRLNTEQVEICVQDQGKGISPEDQSKLFGRFSRVGERKHRKINGHGMGLFLVKEIINGHRGTVWLRSEKGNGSEFFFTLPLTSACEHIC